MFDWPVRKDGGADKDRTCDLLNAIQENITDSRDHKWPQAGRRQLVSLGASWVNTAETGPWHWLSGAGQAAQDTNLTTDAIGPAWASTTSATWYLPMLGLRVASGSARNRNWSARLLACLTRGCGFYVPD